MARIGVLLINIGTPDEPTPEAVGRYLREFLMDGYVLDMPYLKRWLLVNRIIVPRRKTYSAEHYQEVHTEEGSPLMVFTRRFAGALSKELSKSAQEYVVEIGMRYGNPSIRAALRKLESSGVDRVIAVPLYPQYTQSSFVTAVEETKKQAAKIGLADQLSFVPPFYADPGFIKAFAQRVFDSLSNVDVDYLLFSYHGVPVRHIKQLDPSNHCYSRSNCCEAIVSANQNCYRAQCVATTKAIAKDLELSPDGYATCFQSQFGKDEWIGPSLEGLLAELPGRGVRKLAVVCPSFVADCLETLEEIGIRGRAEFKEAGGEELILIPCLNDDQNWVSAIAQLIAQGANGKARAQSAASIREN
jgi:protoporphyrin/coproporphyrin ferrochelatase